MGVLVQRQKYFRELNESYRGPVDGSQRWLADGPPVEHQSWRSPLLSEAPDEQPRHNTLWGPDGNPVWPPPALAGPRPTEARGDAELEMALTMLLLDLLGILDPTPICDGMSGLLSLGQDDYEGAAISALGMIPFVGDLAKAGKLPKYLKWLERAIMRARKSKAFAETFKIVAKKIDDALRLLPWDKDPVLSRIWLLIDRFLNESRAAHAAAFIGGFAQHQLHSVQKLLGKTFAEIPALAKLWKKAAKEGEEASLNLENSIRLFKNHRKRFWALVRGDSKEAVEARRLFNEAGFVLEEGKNTAPFRYMPDGTKFQFTIDHRIERQSAPWLALDPSNLRGSSRRENTVVLRLLHDMDPFQSIEKQKQWIMRHQRK